MDIDKLIEKLKPVFVTKDDLKIFATKEDLKMYATKRDLEIYATKDDLALFANRIIEYIGDLHEKVMKELKEYRKTSEDHEFRITKVENILEI